MSLYYVQKLLDQLNRDPHTRSRYETNIDALLADYDLDEEESAAIRRTDIGLLYVMGVNGQLLMHYAALHGFEWDEYIGAMRAALKEHGNVRAGLYGSVDSESKF